MADYYLLLGSNVGDRAAMLKKATHLIESHIGPVKAKSSIYETEPWGVENQENFLNLALHIESSLPPMAAWKMIEQIQNDLGKTQEGVWGPRNIDIDILYCDDVVLKTPELTIPHPRVRERNFVLVPLMEIAGEFIDPELKINIEEIYDICKDTKEVYLFDNQVS